MPKSAPMAISVSACINAELMEMVVPSFSARVIANNTTGVPNPSLSPLSPLSSRRTRVGTTGLRMVGAPSPASVGASAEAMKSAKAMDISGKSQRAAKKPAAIAIGSAISSILPRSFQSPSNSRGCAWAASWKRMRASVASARSLIATFPAGTSNLANPSRAPTMVKTSGGLT